MVDWEKLYLYVESLLKQQLKPHLTYHNWEHTQYVMAVCDHICDQEQVGTHDRLLIKAAALFHDAGFITTAQGHEEQSILLAKQELPNYGFTSEEIEMISGMIRATIIPQRPQTSLEFILADADLYYLGTDAFETIGTRLFTEMRYYNPDLSIEEWNKIQVKFLQSHHYHTDYCIATLTANKEAHLLRLLEAV